MLKGLEVGVYRFVMRAVDNLYMPEFKGGVLRGGFGTVFKRLACVKGPGRNSGSASVFAACNDCSEALQCPYKAVFEPSPPEGAKRLRNLQDISRPFVLRIPSDPRTQIPAGHRLEWEVVLMGHARRFLPFFVVTFKALGEEGFGLWHSGRRARAVLESVHLQNLLTGDSEVVFDGAANQFINSDNAICTGAQIEEIAGRLRTDLVSLEFLSVTRLKYKGVYVRKPDFHIVIRNLLRRLSTLAYFYQETEVDLDFSGLIAKAERLPLENVSIQWKEYSRYSGRSKEMMDFSGFVGGARYAGDLSPFIPLLLFGSFLNVGKGATFGLGQYVVRS